MNAVPLEKQGRGSGITMAVRILGATVGMAVGSSLFFMTGSYPAVFLTTAGVMFAILLFGWLAIERQGISQTP